MAYNNSFGSAPGSLSLSLPGIDFDAIRKTFPQATQQPRNSPHRWMCINLHTAKFHKGQ